MLAYVFWHRPAEGGDAAAYEAALAGFHAALAADPPPGFAGSCALRLDAAPWLRGHGPAYEDWYLVADWPALGELNAHAVSGSRARPHDAAAVRAGTGIAGVYARVAGPAAPPGGGQGAWFAKPAGLPYPDFHAGLEAALPAGVSVWQRQMTLGPAGEYTVRGAAAPPPGVEAYAVASTRVA